MTAAEPIDLEAMKFEEDLYGPVVKIERKREPSVFEFVTPTKSGKGVKGSGNGSPRTPSHRRHVEDADVQDRVLVAMVDSGLDWSEVMKHFPGISKQALQARYRKKKAKMEVWSTEDDTKLSGFIKEYKDEMWKFVSTKMGRSAMAVEYRAKCLNLS